MCSNPSVNILQESFFQSDDVVTLARQLIGKLLLTSFEYGYTSGRIVETEAYAGLNDKASHAYGGRRTDRTEVMYHQGGVAYVYLCYGMHHLTNVVTNVKEVPHAVLLRALEPLDGIEIMRQRSPKALPNHLLCSGPGRLSRAMGIHTRHTGCQLNTKKFCIADDGYVPNEAVIATPRIGVDYAGEDALLPYRFILEGHASVSGSKSLR